MTLVRRFRLLIGVAVAIGVVAVALHASTQAPLPGKYISWAPPASATASPGAAPRRRPALARARLSRSQARRPYREPVRSAG